MVDRGPNSPPGHRWFFRVLICLVGEYIPEVAGPGSGWANPRSVSPDDVEERQFAIVELRGCASIRFGHPNDEVFHGHPLFGAGLKHYAAHEIFDSSGSRS
jgi:hypothetical protein